MSSLKVLARTKIRSAIRQQIYQNNPQLGYKNSLIYLFNRTGSDVPTELNPPSSVPLRTKVDSGIIEDIYYDDYPDMEDVVIDSDDSDDEPDKDDLDAKEFSDTMRSCIQKLELPKTLLKFVNLNRDL